MSKRLETAIRMLRRDLEVPRPGGHVSIYMAKSQVRVILKELENAVARRKATACDNCIHPLEDHNGCTHCECPCVVTEEGPRNV